MRIAYVDYDKPDLAGGPIVNAQRLLPALRARGHEPVALIFYRQGASPAAEYLREQGVECRTRPWEEHTDNNVLWLLSQVSYLEPDVFVSNLSVPAWIAARWIREAGIPTVGAIRGDDAFHRALVDRFVVGERDWAVSGVFCVNARLRQEVEALRPSRTELVTIPSGVPIPSESRARLHPLRLVYIGRLREQVKRISVVAESFARVLTAFPEATAMLIGVGSDQSLAEQVLAHHEVRGRCTFAGLVRPEAIHDHLADASVSLLMSDHEGTPGAVMDAMACGVVPVCRDVPGGVRELVLDGQTGLLVDDSPESVVAAVRRLVDTPGLWPRLSQAARAHVVAGYSLDVSVDRWEHFLERLVAQAGPRRRMRIPRRLWLPPIHPDLACEDSRWETARRRLANWVIWTAQRICCRPSSATRPTESPMVRDDDE